MRLAPTYWLEQVRQLRFDRLAVDILRHGAHPRLGVRSTLRALIRSDGVDRLVHEDLAHLLSPGSEIAWQGPTSQNRSTGRAHSVTVSA